MAEVSNEPTGSETNEQADASSTQRTDIGVNSGAETSIDPNQAPDIGGSEPEVEPAETSEESQVPDNDADAGGDSTDSESFDGVVKVDFDGTEMEVSLPEELVTLFTDKGIDSKDLITDLYTGEFGLSEKNHAALSELYGAPLVDSYISALKAQNGAALAEKASLDKQAEEANQAIWNETCEQVGGEGNWDILAEFAADSLSEGDFEGFNKAMDSGSRFIQRIAIDNLMSQYKASEGDLKPTLVEPDSVQVDGGKTFLTAQEFLELNKSGEIHNDEAKYVAMRKKGISMGR